MERSSGVVGLSFAGALLGVAGCTSFITPHQVYAPLLDHAGQVDISARGGVTVPGAVGASANVAYAPVDHLEVLGGGDFDFGDETRHFAGHVGLGTFVREDVFRFELIAGTYGGYAEGEASRFGPGTTTVVGVYRLDGPYLMPYAQALIGFESGRAEFAVGLRFYGFFADVTSTQIGGTSVPLPRDGYERAYIEPVVTFRIPFDIVRIDLMTAWPINPRGGGDNSPADLAPESDLMWYFAVGVGFQLDTVEQPAPPEESYVVPPPVYAPAPAPVTYTPAPPPTYAPAPTTTAPGGAAPIISPVPPPESPPSTPPPPP